jgi:hypothetical protein
MIRLPEPTTLEPAERRALSLLVDLARLIPVTDLAADVVTIVLTDRPRFHDLREWKAGGWGISAGDGVVRVARATLHCVASCVTASRERQSETRDRLGRIPSEENALVAAGLEREPIVSQAAATLRATAVAAAGRRVIRLSAPWPAGRRWAVALTHDLDVVAWWPLFTTLRVAELARKGRWRIAGRVATSAVAAIGRAPVQRGVQALLAAERARRIRSTWFILCGRPTWRTMTAGDLTYRPEAAMTRAILRDVQADGHALGLHGSFATVSAPQRLREQRLRLEALAARPIQGARQHFLRFLPDQTPRAMRESEFRYDSTWGFADRNGFRLGVADVLPLWGSENSHGIPLTEAPFAWMDRALSKYRNVEDPDAWVDEALELAHAARAVEGLWVGVWHPNLVPALGYPDAPAAYARLLEGLQSTSPFTGTLDELVAWRETRARLRIDRLAPDGRIEASGATDVPLEEPAQ